MDSELKEYLRLSPYQHSHILKYSPTALLSESHTHSHLTVQAHKTKLSFTQTQMQQKPYQQQNCYFCKFASTPTSPCHSCCECKKVLCDGCVFRCGKCDKVLCQLDKTYDYTHQYVCCFNC